jgi:hypothetical protein
MIARKAHWGDAPRAGAIPISGIGANFSKRPKNFVNRCLLRLKGKRIEAPTVQPYV